MSLHDYKVSQALEHDGVPFYALVMAAMRRAEQSTRGQSNSIFREGRDSARLIRYLRDSYRSLSQYTRATFCDREIRRFQLRVSDQ